MAECEIFKVKIKLIVNICMLNSYLKTKQCLSWWRRTDLATLYDAKQTCMTEVKGVLRLAMFRHPKSSCDQL